MGLFDFFGKSREQLKNEAIAVYNLGNQKSVDRKKALELFTKIVEKYDDADSMYMIGCIYWNGTQDGLFSVDWKKAYSWFKKAYDKDMNYAGYAMALALYYGMGVTQNQPKAVKLILKNHPTLFSLEEIKNLSLYYIPAILGSAYNDGIGVDRNDVKSRIYTEMGVKLNDPLSYGLMAYLYASGMNGIEIDYDEAYKYAQKSINTPCSYANMQSPLAYVILGSLYEDGLGELEVDLKKAYKYYEQAAKLGFEAVRQKMEELEPYL